MAKKILLSIICLFTTISINAQTVVNSGTTGPLTWVLYSNGTLNISGNGYMPNYDGDIVPWNSYVSNIKTVVLTDGVKSIGRRAFSNCYSLTSVTIPNSVTSIGDSAFNGCTSLISVTIPNSVTNIGNSAFYYCTSLTSVTIPNSVTSIGAFAFFYCTRLTEFIVSEQNQNYTTIDGVVFNKNKTTIVVYPCGKKGSYTIPNSVTSIGAFAFFNCYSLTSVTVGWNVPFTVNSDVFGLLNPSNITLYVPSGTKSAYQANLVWGKFNIVESAAVSYTIFASAGNGGAISPSGFIYVNQGSSQSFTFTPYSGYEINQVLIDGVNNTAAVSAGSYTFTNVTANHTISVSFKQKSIPNYTISASAGSGGSILPSGTITVNQGSSQTFTFTPYSGYEINQVLIDGVNNTSAATSGSYTFTNLTANHSISVSFKQKQYTITASAGSGGTISPSGYITVNHGNSQTFTFTPYSGYEIQQVLIDGVNNTSAVSSRSYTFSNVTANHTIAVYFRQSCIPNLTVQVWDDVLSVINEPANNGGHTFVAYQWQKNGEDLAGETSGNLYLAQLSDADYQAQYSVRLTDNGGNTWQTCPVQLHRLSGKVSVYPNPAAQTLTIESKDVKAGDIIGIYNLAGKLVRQYPAEKQQTQLDISSLHKGVYIVKIKDKQVRVIKINE